MSQTLPHKHYYAHTSNLSDGTTNLDKTSREPLFSLNNIINSKESKPSPSYEEDGSEYLFKSFLCSFNPHSYSENDKKIILNFITHYKNYVLHKKFLINSLTIFDFPCKKENTISNNCANDVRLTGWQEPTFRSVVEQKCEFFAQLCQSYSRTRIMINYRNKTKTGSSFSETTIEAVWNKASRIPGRPRLRKDQCGAIICRSSYGMTSEYGWEIDHIYPKSKGGSDALNNLQPLHWLNNRGKSDYYPRWTCSVGR